VHGRDGDYLRVRHLSERDSCKIRAGKCHMAFSAPTLSLKAARSLKRALPVPT
jgi:hypothetical protein